MNPLSQLRVPQTDELAITIVAPATIRLEGTVTAESSHGSIGAFFRAVHEHLVVGGGLPTLRLDVSGLTFVNSGAIRLFIDWAMWVNAAPPAGRYGLHFLTSQGLSWQATTFTALRSLAPGVVTFEPIGRV